MTNWLDTAPALETLQPEDRAWAVNWLRHASGDWGNHPAGNLTHELQRCRNRRPNAANWLILHSTNAARIAANAAWNDTTNPKHQPTQEEIAHVEAAIATLQPANPIRSTADQLDAITTTPLRPYHLTPTTLDQLNPLPNGRKRTT